MAVTGTNITLTTRTDKGSALTHAELDANQTGLKDAVEGHSHDEFAAELGADDNYMTYAEKEKLSGIEAGAKVNVQADWNASTGDTAILNKPSISGLLNEAAHDALDHYGLPGVPVSYTLPVASATVLGGVKVDGTTVLISDGVISSTGGSGGGVTDHGLLTGLSDDDHPQYHNDTRGDARYSRTTHNHNLSDLAEKSYNSLTGKPSIPSVAGLLDETAHDALDHSGLTGVLSIGTTGTTACAGNDSRLSDSRTPNTHSHAQSDVTDLTTDLAGKQATLVSGTNIKTINGASVLGSGDIVISGGGASVQQATVTLSQYASTNITATAVLGVWELPASGVMFTPVMTSNTTPSGEAFASTEYTNSDTYKAWRAFNNNTSDYWASAAAAPPHSVGFDYITPVVKNIYSVDCVSRAGYAIKSWEFQGGESKTGPWTTLDTRTNITSWGQVNTYSFTNTTAYRCYRLYITECVSGTDTDICELKLGTASNVILNPATDYLALRPYATGGQTTTITRLKTGSAAMVIDYI